MTGYARLIARVCTWIVRAADWLRRGGRRRQAATLATPRLLCEACHRNEAAETFWDDTAGRGVAFCAWCAKRFRKVNETMAPSIRTRPTKGGGGGRAA